MERFILTKRTLRSREVEIGKTQFESLVFARKSILEMLRAEEKYDVVVENYLEFERTLLDAALNRMILSGRTEDWFNRDRNTIDRRVFNLLAGCQAFMDSAKHCAKTLANAKDEMQALLDSFESNHFSFRVMKVLRNHVLHSGFSVHFLSFPTEVLNLEEDDFQIRFGTPDLMLASARIPKPNRPDARLEQVIQEIDSTDGKVSFVPLVREFVSDLSQINAHLRTLCRPAISDAMHSIEKAFKVYFDGSHDFDKNVALFARSYENGGPVEEVIISLNSTGRLQAFAAKNQKHQNLHRYFVSNEVRDNETFSATSLPRKEE